MFVSFNPTMVRLLQREHEQSMSVRLGFNPTMVRLLQARTRTIHVRASGFQSHNGAIAANHHQHRYPCSDSFNPTMVRLLLAMHELDEES